MVECLMLENTTEEETRGLAALLDDTTVPGKVFYLFFRLERWRMERQGGIKELARRHIEEA